MRQIRIRKPGTDTTRSDLDLLAGFSLITLMYAPSAWSPTRQFELAR
jgi:hypothetical protein